MAGLATMLAGAQPLDGGFAVTIDEDWLQGRTAYGGLTSAIALAAARTIAGDLPLRSAQLSMVGPLSGRVEARARMLRQGRNATWIAVELVGSAGVGFAATFVFMRAIESAVALDEYSLPDGLIDVGAAKPVPTEHAPAFLRHHFEVRFALPKSALGQADLCWWVRLRDRDGLSAEVECLLCGDALPVAVWPLVGMKTPISSMQWHVNMLDPRAAADGWWLIRSTSRFARDGGASEHIMQWNGQGRVALAGMQSVAVFG